MTITAQNNTVVGSQWYTSYNTQASTTVQDKLFVWCYCTASIKHTIIIDPWNLSWDVDVLYDNFV